MKNTPQAPTQDFSRLIGIPYESHNCWDIAVKFYADILNIDLHNIYSGSTPERAVTENLISTNKGDFVRVDCPEFGDIAVIKLFGYECHIAVYVGEGKILHTKRGIGSIVDSVDKWKHLVVGYFRVKAKDVKD